MKSKLPITVIIAARNEELNIGKCMSSLQMVERIIVVDSDSDDQTQVLAEEHGAEVIQFQYNGAYPKKRQWALDNLNIETNWVFMLDADEEVTDLLWEEIKYAIQKKDCPEALMIRKGFHFMGKKFEYGGFSHPAVLLWKTGKGKFEETLATDANQQDMEVHERVLVSGHVESLKQHLIHNDFKGLHAYYDRHNKYASWEAELRYQFLITGKWGESDLKAKLFGNSQEFRRFVKKFIILLPFEPWIWFVYHYFIRLGFLEGRRGLIASQIRREYIRQVRTKVYELQLKNRCSTQSDREA